MSNYLDKGVGEVGAPALSSQGTASPGLRPEPASGLGPDGRVPTGAEDFNTVWDNRPAAPTCEKLIEVHVVGRRCVYVNNYRIAGGKPYFSENLPSHTLKTTLGEVLDAFKDGEIRKALAERKARRDYMAAYHAAKARGQS